MGVINIASEELTEGFAGNGLVNTNKVRLQHFNVPALVAAADPTSTIELCKLPPGKIKVLPTLSRYKNSAFGVGAKLDIGHKAYIKAEGVAAEALDDDAFTPTELDVAAAANGAVLNAVNEFSIISKAGITVIATVSGAAMPIGATLSGWIAYIAQD